MCFRSWLDQYPGQNTKLAFLLFHALKMVLYITSICTLVNLCFWSFLNIFNNSEILEKTFKFGHFYRIFHFHKLVNPHVFDFEDVKKESISWNSSDIFLPLNEQQNAKKVKKACQIWPKYFLPRLVNRIFASPSFLSSLDYLRTGSAGLRPASPEKKKNFWSKSWFCLILAIFDDSHHGRPFGRKWPEMWCVAGNGFSGPPGYFYIP